MCVIFFIFLYLRPSKWSHWTVLFLSFILISSSRLIRLITQFFFNGTSNPSLWMLSYGFLVSFSLSFPFKLDMIASKEWALVLLFILRIRLHDSFFIFCFSRYFTHLTLSLSHFSWLENIFRSACCFAMKTYIFYREKALLPFEKI